jgi:aspartate racemase
MRKPIIILGGMGAHASLHLHKLLLQKSLAYHDGSGDDYPHIVHLSLPVPDFISDESQKFAAIATLEDLAPTIDALHPEQILLACNTAHLLRPDATLLRRKTFLSLLETVAGNAASNRCRRVGLLASPTTIRTKLYDEALQHYGISSLAPTAKEQQSVESVIRNVIAGRQSIHDSKRLARIVQSLQASGADAVLLGCTELPLVFDDTCTDTPIINCLDVYASASTQKYYLYNGG